MLFSFNVGLAQTPFYKNYSIESGLPSATVYDIIQDSDGYMWMATDNGVAKYNGSSFKKYYSEDGMGDNHIFKVFEDRKKRIWFLPQNGMLSYLFKDSFFSAKNNAFLKKKYISNHPYFIYYESSNGDLYFGQYRTQILQLGAEGHTEFYNIDNNISSIWQDGDSIITIRGYKITTIKGHVIDSLPIRSIENFSRVCVYSDTALIANGKEIFLYNKGKLLEEKIRISNKYQEIISLHIIDNEIWIGTRKGVLRTKSINSLRDDKYDEYLGNYSITSSCKDFEGNYWFSTLEHGVFFIPSFSLITYDNLISNKGVKCIERGLNNILWVGDSKGNYYIMTDDQVMINTVSSVKPSQVTSIHYEANKVRITSKSAILELKGTKKHFLSIFANDLFYDKKSGYWLASSQCYRINELDYNNALKSTYKPVYTNPADLGVMMIDEVTNTVEKGSSNNIWVGTKNGLWIINANNYEKQKVRFDKINVIEKRFDNMVVGTESEGVVFYKGVTPYDTINARDGLSASNVLAINSVSADTVWVGTVNGVDLLYREGEGWKTTNITGLLGIGAKRVNDIAELDSLIYLATEEGLISFDKTKLSNTVYSIPIVIENVSVNNKPVSLFADISLSYTSNNIAIKYTGLSYKSKATIKYLYTLDGLDNEWHKTDVDNINYASLPAGSYTFKVKAINALGIASDGYAQLKFNVTAPIWKRTWFYLLLVVGFALVIVVIALFRIRYMKKAYELKSKTENLKLTYERDIKAIEQKALRMQMNPHFLFNALNTIKGYYANNKHAEGSTYISKFSKLLRLILESDDHIISLETEINILDLYFDLSKVRYNNAFNYSIETEVGIIPSEVSIIPMLLQPFVENAIIHGVAPKSGKGMIKVMFNKSGVNLVCVVEDNGVGRSYNKTSSNTEYQSKAIEVTRSRLDVLSKSSAGQYSMIIEDLKDENGSPEGTRVTIVIPFKLFW